MQDKQLLKDIIEDEAKDAIIEVLKTKQYELQKKDIITLIDNINNENLLLNINI